MPDATIGKHISVLDAALQIGLHGETSRRQRHFPELTDEEVERFEEAVRAAKEAATPPPDDPPSSAH